MEIPHVVPGRRVLASEQNALIDQLNQNTEDISNLQVPGGDLEFVQDLIDDSIGDHVTNTAPHPAYDDIPSLTVLFENGLV